MKGFISGALIGLATMIDRKTMLWAGLESSAAYAKKTGKFNTQKAIEILQAAAEKNGDC